MPQRDFAWRAMTAADAQAVETIAALVHPGFFEAPEVLAERQRLYPGGCHLLEIGSAAAGYVLSHPWRAAAPPALNVLLRAIPADADTYYLHDLALLPEARGIGAAGRIVAALARHAAGAGFATLSLVAVNASRGFWERHGFAVRNVPTLAAKLRSYEAGAQLMERPSGR